MKAKQMPRPKEVCDEHKSLYHYTTASGLNGILRSQALWATNISYLNDAEEHIGFFNRRVPHLVAEVAKDFGSGEKSRVVSMIDTMREATLKFNSPYIASFCSAKKLSKPSDGLLSQWRGYGIDGGYAIEFESKSLEDLLEKETSKFQYQYVFWGDVEYNSHDGDKTRLLPETVEDETKLKECVRKFLKEDDESALESLLDPITRLSCCYKHPGFCEEAEVRMGVLLPNGPLRSEAQRQGEAKPAKPVEFIDRNGVLVPYVSLFGDASERLPIRSVIVGPHHEKQKRKVAVQLLLDQCGVEAEVIVSDIPYIGR